MSAYYEVWHKGAPLTVHVRDDKQRYCWDTKEEAIAVARESHRRHPNCHFIVREAKGHNGPYAKVYDTSVKET